MNAGCLSLDATIDDFVLAYESAQETGDAADIASFFPPPDHPRRSQGIVELLRVDLEYAWRDGVRDRLDQHVARFAGTLDRRQLAEVAYEDFRLRRSAGESVTRANYAQRFEIDTAKWPELPVGNSAHEESQDASASKSLGWLSEISRSDPELAEKLADVLDKMPDVGQQFGGFELVGELGRGAFGRVFLARQGSLANRLVALKVTPQWSEEPQHLAQLQHTNIVPIYSLHQHGQLQAICMPYLGASTLVDLMRARKEASSLSLSGKLFETTIRARHATTIGKLSEAKAAVGDQSLSAPNKEAASAALTGLGRMTYLEAVVRTMARVTEGLAFAHDHGVVHRDLKPANVLISDDGQPLILDFHIAAQMATSSAAAATAGGTIPYMAPEALQSMASGASSGDARSDIYSIGVILYELLTGRRPFAVKNGPVELMAVEMLAERHAPPRSPQQLNADISPGLAAIVLKCLAFDPVARYATAHDLHEDLRRHLEHRPLKFAKDRSLLERTKKFARRHPRLSSASSVLALSLCLILVIGSSWAVRGSQLASARARDSMRDFHRAAVEVAAVLDVPDIDEQAVNDAVAAAERALAPYAIDENQSWQQRPLVARLTDAERTNLLNEIASLHFVLAGAKADQAMRASTRQERTQLLDAALTTNRVATSIYPGDQAPLAFAMQKARFERAKEGAPPLREQLPAEAVSDAFEDRYLLYLELARSHRWIEAANVLQQLLTVRPQDTKVWVGLGACHLSLGELADAEHCLSTAIALNPDQYAGYLCRAMCRMSLGQYAAAIDDCNAALARRARPAAYINRAIARHAIGQVRLAIEDLETAIEKGNTETRVYFLRAKWKRALGDTKGAAADRTEGLTRIPTDALSYVARAVAQLEDNPAAALTDCQEALKLNPASQSALQNMAYLYGEKLSQPEKAISTLTRFIEVAPRNAMIVASRGVYYARLGQRDSAIADGETALKLNDKPMTHYRVACIYAITSQKEPSDASKATDALAKALQRQAGLATLAQRDPDMDFLRTSGRFNELMEAALRLESSSSSVP
jgi:serine/threonine protein kinase/Flp pilus assembly protein TadD